MGENELTGKEGDLKKENGKIAESSEEEKRSEEEEGTDFFFSSSDLDQVKGRVSKRTEKFVCPELNDAFGIPAGKNATFILSQCDLSTYLRLQQERQVMSQVFLSGLVKALQSKDEEEIGRILAKNLLGSIDGKEISTSAKFELDLCHACVVEPKLKRSDWIWMSEMFPMTVNKIANKITDLTLKGGIKKN